VLEAQFGRLPVADVTSDAIHSDDLPARATHDVEALADQSLEPSLRTSSMSTAACHGRKHPRQPEVTSGGIDETVEELRLGVELVRRVPGDGEGRRAHELEAGSAIR